MWAGITHLEITLVILSHLLGMGTSFQRNAAIQFFLPGGNLPGREIRFTLTREDGETGIFATDTRGRYQPGADLAIERQYRIVIEGDKRSYETTIVRFRIKGNTTYVPVFLRPIKSEAPPAKEIMDVSAYDSKATTEARAAYERAMKAVSDNDAEAAIGEFTHALSLYPQYLRALNDLGSLYLKFNRLDDAVSTFSQSISLNSGHYFARLNLGIAYNRQGKYGEAINVLDKLTREQPSLSQARMQLADALLSSRQTDASIEQLRLALADTKLESVDRVNAHLSLGFLYNREERFGAAVKELEKAIVINPKIARAHFYLGEALLNLGRNSESEAELKKAYELGGSAVAGAQFLLGHVYMRQQKNDLAQRAFEQYLEDLPRAPNAAQVRALLDQIKSSIK